MIYDQFGRYCQIIVGDLLIDELDVVFSATRTLKKDPNTLSLTIYNLSPDRRKKLQERKTITVQIDAGYQGQHGVIFLGDVREVKSHYEGTNWVTKIESADGEKAVQKGRVNKSFHPGVSFKTVVEEIAKTIPEIKKGNLSTAIATAKLRNGGLAFPNGITVSGNSVRELERLMKSAGFQWSIQDGAFQVLEASKALITTAVVLTPETGLIGSPTIGSDGIVELDCLMNSDIIPGKQLVIDSLEVKGRFRAERVVYDGDTNGQSWYCKIEAQEM